MSEWRTIDSAPEDVPILAGYWTQTDEWYWHRFETSEMPAKLGYTHWCIPTPPGEADGRKE